MKSPVEALVSSSDIWTIGFDIFFDISKITIAAIINIINPAINVPCITLFIISFALDSFWTVTTDQSEDLPSSFICVYYA